MCELHKILDLSAVIPVLTIDRIEQALPLAEALLEGGLRVLEITLRSEAALPAISAIAQAFPHAVLGAGTVLDDSTLRAAQAAGATFVVSPGYTDALLDAAAASNMPILPGACTASEVMHLLARGISTMKFFPAEAVGGLPLLGAFAGPFPTARFCPTGGIKAGNAAAYLALPNVVAVGGSWMATDALLAAADWPQVRELAAQAASLSRGS